MASKEMHSILIKGSLISLQRPPHATHSKRKNFKLGLMAFALSRLSSKGREQAIISLWLQTPVGPEVAEPAEWQKEANKETTPLPASLLG